MAIFIHTTHDQYCHTDNSAIYTNLFIQCIHPQNGVHSIGKRPIPKLIDLLVESFAHLADLISGQIFNAETLCQLLHFSSGNALYKCLLNDLNECSLTALAFRDKERDITALTNLGHHEVHRSHAGIQTTRTVSAAVAASSVCALTFLCAQLLIHLSFHELCAEPFQHGIRLRDTLP